MSIARLVPGRRLLAAVVLALVSPAALAAECRGHDLMQRFRGSHPDLVRHVEAEGGALPFGRGRLFRLRRDGSQPSWVFGTIHSADPRVGEPTVAVRSALAEAKTVALELDTDPESADPFAGMPPAEIARLMLAPPGGEIPKLVTRADLRQIETAARPYGFPPDMVRAVQPSILAAIMSIPACASKAAGGKPILDSIILKAARDAGQRVVGLETFAEQMSAMRDFPRADQKKLIVSTVRHLGETENMLETLLALYARGEIGQILALSRLPRPIPTIDAPVPPVFYDQLIDRRNERMAERATPLLAEGSTFVAVGAAHLPGETGLLRLFERRGYAVERIE